MWPGVGHVACYRKLRARRNVPSGCRQSEAQVAVEMCYQDMVAATVYADDWADMLSQISV